MQIKIKMSNPSQKHPVYAKSPNEDLKNMDVIYTFKIKVERQKLDQGVSNTSDHIQIKIKMPNSSQEPPSSFQSPKSELKRHGCLLHLQNRNKEPKF